jgi:hypothetical protein
LKNQSSAFRSRKEEIQALSGPNEFPEFYSRLKNIRQYYPKNPSEEVCSNNSISFLNYLSLFKIAVPMSIEYEQFMRQLQETEDGEPLGIILIEKILSNHFIFSSNSISKFYG